MFRSARLKLTAWYLLIIMSVSISFSIVIYQVLNREVERFARSQRMRIERRYRDSVIPQIIPVPDGVFIPQPLPLDPDLIEETSRHILMMLVIVDGVIFIVSGYLGYILAGQTLRPIAQMLDEQNRFISDSSHELRTPLTALKSTLEVNLRDKQLNLADAKTVLKESLEEVDKLQSLSDSLLQLIQYQKQNITKNFENVKIQEVISETFKKMKSLAENKHIKLTANQSDITVYGNKYSLNELLTIMIDNAIKYSPENGKVTVTTKKNKTTAYISVTDSGMGIAEKDLNNIFDRFYRADAARSKNSSKGYGLGLSIAKKIVESHNGSISVKSDIGKGSTFTIQLPLNFS